MSRGVFDMSEIVIGLFHCRHCNWSKFVYTTPQSNGAFFPPSFFFGEDSICGSCKKVSKSDVSITLFPERIFILATENVNNPYKGKD